MKFQNMVTCLRIAAILAVLSFASTAQAQSIDPGSVPPSVEQPREREKPETPLSEPGAGPIQIPPLPESGEVPAQAAEVFVTLGGVSLEGAPAGLDPAALSGAWKDLVGQRINVARLYELARDLTRQVRSRGYLLSQVVLPPQEIGQEGGTVAFRFVQGYVSATSVQGTPGDQELLAPYQEKIAAERPLTAHTLERYLLLMNELGGLRVRSELGPDPSAIGGARLTNRVESRVLEGSLFVSNEGPRYLGRERAGIVIKVNQAFNAGDQTALSATTSQETRELTSFSASNRVPLGAEGIQLQTSASYSRTQPAGELRAFELEGSVTKIDLGVSQPLLRSRFENIRWQAGVSVYDGRLQALETTTLWKVRLASASARVIYDTAKALDGVILLSAGVEQGFDGFRAGVQSRADARETFTVLSAAAAFGRLLGDTGLSVQCSADGSYARDPLPSSVEYAASRSARGYDTGEISGYRGFGATAELRYGGIPDARARLNGEVYAFYDTTTVWHPGHGSDRRQSVSSTGTGLRFDLLGRVRADVYAAFPISPDVASYGDKAPRFLFNLSMRF